MTPLPLVHLTTGEERDAEVVNFYPPANLIVKWGELSGLFLANLRKCNGQIKGIATWRIKDLFQARAIYAELAGVKRIVPDRFVRPDDLAAIKHWKDKGIL